MFQHLSTFIVFVIFLHKKTFKSYFSLLLKRVLYLQMLAIEHSEMVFVRKYTRIFRFCISLIISTFYVSR